MKKHTTHLTKRKNKPMSLLIRGLIMLLLGLLLHVQKSFAHTVDYFTSCGYTCSGSSLTVDVHISNVTGNSKYNWQFRDDSKVWKCFINGSNSINGAAFTVSGAIGSGVKSNMPLTIQNAGILLNGVEVRLAIADGGSPCTTNPSYTIWGTDKMLRLHVLTGSDCATIASNCGSGGCAGNLLNDANGYYGGFESGAATIGAASSDYTVSSSATSCGQFKIVNTVPQAQPGFPAFAPHSGNFMLYADGSSAAGRKVWSKTVNVAAGTIYQFSAWVANANNTGNQRASISLRVNGTSLPGASLTVSSVAGDWLYVTGSYIATSAATVSLQIVDNNTSCTDNDFVVDDICFKSNGSTIAIGNQVWNDINGDGNKDADEPGIGGVVVKLYVDNNGDNSPDGGAVQSAATATNGTYSFSNLTPGKYIVGIIIPASYIYGPGIGTGSSGNNPDNNIDNDNNGVIHLGANIAGSEERTRSITLSAGNEPTDDGDGPDSNNTLDLALQAVGGIGDFVWNDMNKNGLQEPNEMGITNVKVTLSFPDNTTTRSTYTNARGLYSFDNLGPGSYTVKFQTPAGMTESPAHVGTDETKDSDPVSGSVALTLPAGQSNYTYDAGFYQNATCSPSAINTDGDCVPDADDIDDDNDGILDVVESGGYDPLKDCDGDGIVNYKDPTPGCPVPSGHDIYGLPYKPIVWSDCNNDGINDFFDWDKDGIINELDLDSDNDGIVDLQETRDSRRLDNNNDGMVDGVDQDGDGLLSSADFNDHLVGGPGLTPEDLDRDGTPNYLDLDSDGDGLVDNREALELDAAGNNYFGLTMGTKDDDNDGVRTVNYTNNENDADNYKGFGAKGIVLKDNDNDGIPDAYDIDSDNDGITDNVEGQPTCSEVQPLGIDADKDGLDDAYDVDISNCPPRGAGITPYDKDFDGTPDLRDLDTDNDTAPDINEGSGIFGNFVTMHGDADRDGLIDQFDIFNIRTATGNFTANVVHGNMGANGSLNGPAIAGSQARLPGFNCPSDRDWRNVSVLPLTMLNFKGNLFNNTARLNWKTANETNIGYYVVERSRDGKNFTNIGKVAAKGSGTEAVYDFADDVSDIAGANVYYRLSQVDKSGNYSLSNILIFKVDNKSSNIFTISPNPASIYFVLKINTAKEGKAVIKITDMLGKTILNQVVRTAAGTNAISFSDLSKFSSGTYYVQVVIGEEVLNQRLIVVK